MRVKNALFFYNTNLLDKICNAEDVTARVRREFAEDLHGGDLVKFIGNDKSCIVKILAKSSLDVNGYREIMFDLVKVVKGELEIEYDI